MPGAGSLQNCQGERCPFLSIIPQHAPTKTGDSERFAIPGLRDTCRASDLVSCEKPIGVPGTVDVEADQFSVVVEAVDDGGSHAVWVIDRLPVRIIQQMGQQEAVHLARAVDISTNDLIRLVDPEGRRVGRVREVELAEGRPLQQEPGDGSIRQRQEADHVAVVVDPRCQRIGSAGRDDGAELPTGAVQLVGVVDPVAVGVEADRDTLIVEAEQLIDRARARVRVRVGGEDALPLDEPEVVAVGIDPEAGRRAMVVNGRDLGLHRTWEVLVGVVPLAIG